MSRDEAAAAQVFGCDVVWRACSAAARQVPAASISGTGHGCLDCSLVLVTAGNVCYTAEPESVRHCHDSVVRRPQKALKKRLA
jgi:hypothetical protein